MAIDLDKYAKKPKSGTSAKSNLSYQKSLIDLLMSPEFAALTGTADPLAAVGGSSGSLPFGASPQARIRYNSYANSADPQVQTILAAIDSGANEIDIINDIDRGVLAAPTGYNADMAKAMVRELASERDSQSKAMAQFQYEGGSAGGGGGSKDFFGKSYLPNPNEMYTAETAPLDARQAKVLGSANTNMEQLLPDLITNKPRKASALVDKGYDIDALARALYPNADFQRRAGNAGSALFALVEGRRRQPGASGSISEAEFETARQADAAQGLKYRDAQLAPARRNNVMGEIDTGNKDRFRNNQAYEKLLTSMVAGTRLGALDSVAGRTPLGDNIDRRKAALAQILGGGLSL
jgi:hypothetical protein